MIILFAYIIMNKNIERVAVQFYLSHPKMRKFMLVFRDTFFPMKPRFSGLAIKTFNDPPWIDETKNSVFNKASDDIKNFQFGSVLSTGIDIHKVDSLLWRHWIVSYATKHALKFAKSDNFIFVECGVGDGMSIFYTLREISTDSKICEKSKIHLFDSWGPMKKEDLLESELGSEDRYSELELNATQNNLKEYDDLIIYHKGYIPKIFDENPESPDSIIYMHIDLNSTKPTIDSLEYFFPRLVSGGVILFDDYGWNNHKDTKHAVDNFFKDKSGSLLHLPTGQAIFYKY
jgi:O-methyltransferase